jgi:ATP-dependent DNA helicase RecG
VDPAPVTTVVPLIMRAMVGGVSEMEGRAGARGEVDGRRDTEPHPFASRDRAAREELARAPVRWPRPSHLRAPLPSAPGKLGAGLDALGLNTVGDLLEHLPRDTREARTINALVPGEQATVAVQVRSIRSRPVRRRGMRPLVEATVADASGTMRVTFFNQPWLVRRYPAGTQLLLHGQLDARGFRVSHHALGAEAPAGGDDAPEIPGTGVGEDAGTGAVAHYAATEGVSSTQILTLVQAARPALAEVAEMIPASVRARERLCARADALAGMHFPRGEADALGARSRLAFEELLLAQLALLRRRCRRSASEGATPLHEPRSVSARWLQSSLPFALTGAQERAISEIDEDLRRPRPMQRLLMGEVGSGKTVVALYAMLRAIEHGCQAALMAPTETLAEQHFATLQQLLGAEPVSAALLTSSVPARRRREVIERLASGELSLLVGTHALIEPDVAFRSLAVAIVDEQHRFGVRQRAALDAKGVPHTLHMTATPIPRTLALAVYGDLDTSALHDLPAGRKAVDTRVVSGERARAAAYEQVREELRAGRQAFVVCPLIAPDGQGRDGERAAAGEGGAEAVRAAVAELDRLRAGELSEFELVLLHGAMRPREKQDAMDAFASGAAQVLVATTVIEVGIDVPNATVMLIENAERFGLSQLHQLRGRVGRGAHGGVCLLMGEGAQRSQRLRELVEHSDGFALAEVDLRMRKEGELLGTRQSGFQNFRVACLPDDSELLERARAHAEAIVDSDPELTAPEHVLLGDELRRRYGDAEFEPVPA